MEIDRHLEIPALEPILDTAGSDHEALGLPYQDSVETPEDGSNRDFEVDFSVTLSPTYAVPVLWFNSSAFGSVDDVYNLLLADIFRDAVRDVGVIGGVSQAVGFPPISPSWWLILCSTILSLTSRHSSSTLVTLTRPCWRWTTAKSCPRKATSSSGLA